MNPVTPRHHQLLHRHLQHLHRLKNSSSSSSSSNNNNIRRNRCRFRATFRHTWFRLHRPSTVTSAFLKWHRIRFTYSRNLATAILARSVHCILILLKIVSYRVQLHPIVSSCCRCNQISNSKSMMIYWINIAMLQIQRLISQLIALLGHAFNLIYYHTHLSFLVLIDRGN